MVDPLLPWAPFFYSFGPGLFVIKILADWLRLRLYVPLTSVGQRSRSKPSGDTSQEASKLRKRYQMMDYRELRNALIHAPDRETSQLAQEIMEDFYIHKAEERYHIHHFVFGLPLMFLSWGLFVYGESWWGLCVAGIVAALFLSELRELITQKWEP